MFKEGMFVLYKPMKRFKELERRELVAVFDRLDGKSHARIRTKRGTEFHWRRRVRLETIRPYEK